MNANPEQDTVETNTVTHMIDVLRRRHATDLATLERRWQGALVESAERGFHPLTDPAMENTLAELRELKEKVLGMERHINFIDAENLKQYMASPLEPYTLRVPVTPVVHATIDAESSDS